jgi:phosphoglycerate dehydrogenase-like enzyme
MAIAPSKYPFHELDNVWMTPHIAAWTTGMVDRRWSEIARNLDSLARGEPLLHQLR